MPRDKGSWQHKKYVFLAKYNVGNTHDKFDSLQDITLVESYLVRVSFAVSKLGKPAIEVESCRHLGVVAD